MINKIKILASAILVLAVSACSNLDESLMKVITDDVTVEEIYSESFELGIGKFTQYSETGNEVWAYHSSGYMIMTGYTNSVYSANVDWLISPSIDLSEITASHFTFNHVARYFTDPSADATIWVSDDFTGTGDPNLANWTQVVTPPFKDPGAWPNSLPSAGEYSLTKYAGKKVYVAFKYKSSATKAGTWELNNFKVKKGEASVSANVLYSNTFGSSKGDFTAVSTLGDQKWEYSATYGCMLMTGYVGSRYANEDWLVSPEIDLTSVVNSYVTFDHAGKFFGTPTNEATLWVSENYTDSANFASASWTKVNIMNYFTNTSYDFISSGNLDLSSYAGKKIRIALKYTCTTSVAGTWEVKNFAVYEGKASGSEEVPFNVSEAVAAQSGGSAWVEGYIVGYAWPFKTQYAYYLGADTCTQVTNVILSDTVGVYYSSKSVALQLPRGTLRSLVNLKENKSMLSTKIKVFGTLSSNAGIAGIINPTKYELPDGTTGTVTINTLYTESFASNLGAFTQIDKLGTQVWKFSSGYGAVMTGYANSVNNANEDWLVSPEYDLTGVSSAALTFDHTINKGVVANMRTEQTLWVTSDNGVSWTQVAIPTYPAGNNWTFVSAGEVSIDAFAGKKIKVAFKYKCTTSSSATWEVKNFKIFN
ncbi:MAG: choice-of-anchor J domain-containing protein [Paludibacter sp.]